MNRIPKKARKFFKNFIAWGGLAGFVAYLIEGEIWKALLIALIIGVVVILDEHFN